MRKVYTFSLIAVIGCFSFFYINSPRDEVVRVPIGETVSVPHQVHSVATEDFSIRLLVLKHSREAMADGDAQMALDAVRAAASKGLEIRDIGNHNIDQTEKLRLVVWEYDDVATLKQFVSDQMSLHAKPGDTLIIFTIGHGMPSGELHNLGQRSEVMRALSEPAAEHRQKVLWWQLSCYAASQLPAISSLPAGEKELFSVLATSPANQESPAYVEGKIMEKVFVSIAEDGDVNPDHNDEISGDEFRRYLNVVRPGRGDLLFTLDFKAAIFGVGRTMPNRIPIRDRNNPQGEYPKDYIPG